MMMVRTMVRMTMVMMIRVMIYLMSIMMTLMRMVMRVVMTILSLAGLRRRVGDWLAVKENQSLSLECRSSGAFITIIITILIHYNHINNSL